MIDAIWKESQQLLLAATLATAVVLLVRPWLRRTFGAELAYLAWAAVPLALVAVLLPQASTLPPYPAGAALTLPGLASLAPAPGQAAFDPRPWLLLAWCLGALLMAAALVRRQRAYARRIRRRPGGAFDLCDQASPAVLGLWRPRIVLPGDFDRRYDVQEQALLLAHEREHLRRKDIPAQAIAAALCCLFWFNPLLLLAWRRFRLDQELACDAAVLRRHPNERRRYGEAMLKTQLATLSLPIGCHWPSRHPLKERLTMLKQTAPGTARRRIGSGLVAAGLAVFALAAWAGQPPETAAASKIAPLQTLTTDDVIGHPKYPEAAKTAGVSGLVVLDVLIGEDGVPADVRVHRSSPEGVFEQAAIEAARGWRFNAGREGRRGKKVEGWVRVPVKFTPPVESAAAAGASGA
ncbi:MAG TPA: TonB family protein [Arenimonas sp.]|nr:TonB family protein [Arenimonas sp.]